MTTRVFYFGNKVCVDVFFSNVISRSVRCQSKSGQRDFGDKRSLPACSEQRTQAHEATVQWQCTFHNCRQLDWNNDSPKRGKWLKMVLSTFVNFRQPK